MNFDKVRALLWGIEQGNFEVRKELPSESDILENHYGHVGFTINEGWIFCIFFDCGAWDSIDNIISPDRERIFYDDLPQDLKNYRPLEKVRREIYKSPGYLGCYLNEVESEG